MTTCTLAFLMRAKTKISVATDRPSLFVVCNTNHCPNAFVTRAKTNSPKIYWEIIKNKQIICKFSTNNKKIPRCSTELSVRNEESVFNFGTSKKDVAPLMIRKDLPTHGRPLPVLSFTMLVQLGLSGWLSKFQGVFKIETGGVRQFQFHAHQSAVIVGHRVSGIVFDG